MASMVMGCNTTTNQQQQFGGGGGGGAFRPLGNPNMMAMGQILGNQHGGATLVTLVPPGAVMNMMASQATGTGCGATLAPMPMLVNSNTTMTGAGPSNRQQNSAGNADGGGGGGEEKKLVVKIKLENNAEGKAREAKIMKNDGETPNLEGGSGERDGDGGPGPGQGPETPMHGYGKYVELRLSYKHFVINNMLEHPIILG